jgi:hypothetical protein
MAVVRAFLIGCAVLLVVGCAGVRSEAPRSRSRDTPKPPRGKHARPKLAAPEQARCGGTRTTVRQGFHRRREDFLTNDLPGCPKGGPLTGTDKSDNLDGKDGDDEVRGYGETRLPLRRACQRRPLRRARRRLVVLRRSGNDVIHGGPGDDSLLTGGDGDDVI